MTDERAEQAFRDAFAQQADRLEPGPLPDVVRRRRRRWPVLAAAAVIVAGALAVGLPEDEPGLAPSVADPGPAVPQSPGMSVTPGVAVPGQVVSVTYRKDWTRGVAYQLARPDAPDAPAYVMGASDTSVFWASTDDEHAFNDLGVSGLGPDRVPVPDDIEAGEWVLCTANARPQKCTSLTVPEEGPAPQPVTEIPAEDAPPVTVWLDPSRQFLTVETWGSGSCPDRVTSVRALDEQTLVVRAADLFADPDLPCTADLHRNRDTWPLVGDQAEHATYAVVATGGGNEGVRTEIMIGTPPPE